MATQLLLDLTAWLVVLSIAGASDPQASKSLSFAAFYGALWGMYVVVLFVVATK